MATTRPFYAQRKSLEQLSLPGISVLLVVILTVVVLIPQIIGSISDQREIGDLRLKVARLTEKATLLANLDSAELSVRSLELSQALPADEDLGYFMTAIRSMSRRAGLVFTGVDFVGGGVSQPTYAPGVPKVARRRVAVQPKENFVRLAVLLSGDMGSLETFLREVEASVPLSVIEEFSFSRDQGSLLVARLTLKYFYSPLPETLGKTDQPAPVVTQAEEQLYDRLTEFRAPEVVQLPRIPTGNPNLML